MAATPKAAEQATTATPNSSPHIMYIAFFTPIDIPNVNASNIHIPGVMETKKKVGINSDKNANDIVNSTSSYNGVQYYIPAITVIPLMIALH